MKKLTVLVMLILFAGCASTWKQAGGRYESSSHNFVVEIPQGWMELNSTDYLLLSKDGPFLQYMFAQRRHVDQPFQHSKMRMQKGMTPEEAGKVFVSEIESDPSLFAVQIKSNVPMSIDGQKGFKVDYTCENDAGLRLRTIYCGLLHGDWMYSIRFTAADRFYFEKDEDIFNRVVESFKLIKT